MEPDAGGAWPPPHPSPPLPPPREYGAPGTSRDPRPLLLGAVAVVLVVVVVAGLAWALRGDDDGRGTLPGPTTAGPTTAGSSPAGSGTSTSPAASAPVAAYACWDGSRVADLATCSLPDGAAGLAWVYPQLAQQRCGKPTAGDGAATRILCLARQDDGTRAVVLYRQWSSVAAARRLYDDHDKPAPRTRWVDRLYPRAPYSVTVTVPAPARVDPALLAARAPGRLRGEPVQ